ncbi:MULTISPECIES: hypothetical protein [unclassified Sinorhizobium]|uniref:hypothetical protein n=1 Tax=unclassified Sinorhizobium TaxID=2613772 RepID=UPI003523F544
MSAMLARYLKDFGETKPEISTPSPEIFEEDGAFDFGDISEDPPVDIEAERREAYAQGHAAAVEELSQKHQTEIEELTSAHRREIEALSRKYETDTAALIAAKVREIASAVADTVSSQAAEAIAPVLTEALTETAVANLARLIEEAVLEGSAGPITVRGPRSLFDLLIGQLGEDAGLLRHIEADDLDLSVDIGDAALVTRISAWAVSLRKVLE